MKESDIIYQGSIIKLKNIPTWFALEPEICLFKPIDKIVQFGGKYNKKSEVQKRGGIFKDKHIISIEDQLKEIGMTLDNVCFILQMNQT